jgi:hypothetical protein
MSRFARYTGGVAAAAMLMLLAPVSASAGGPTSVLLVSPARQATASLYHSDEAYERLTKLLGDNPQADPAAPDLSGGPGSDAINVTWLIHDVQIWRVDRIFTDAKDGPWISTTLVPDGNSQFPDKGALHRASDPKELIALLSALRLLGSEPVPAIQGPKPAAAEAPAVQPTAAPVSRQPADLNWLWLVIGVAAGATLVVGFRPLARRLRPN